MMLRLIAEHPVLFAVACLAFGLLLVAADLVLATRAPAEPDTARHRGRRRAWRLRTHQPRHAALYTPRHEVATGGPVVLGAHPDGDITLVHADPPAEPAVQPGDEPTVETRALIGASA